MFICKPCADEREVSGIGRSFGACELCLTGAVCYDIPSAWIKPTGYPVTRSQRMKGYEDAWRFQLPPKSYSILRVDGRAFHTLTRGMDRPFDLAFMRTMDQVGVALCQEVQGAQFAYVQSDEVSVLMTDFGSMQEPWFGGVIQKMVSVAACVATNAFNTGTAAAALTGRLAQFDARVFTVPNRNQAINYFMWRQADAYRNAVSMAAEAHFSSKRLLNKTVGDRLIMLAEVGVTFDDYPPGARQGRVVTREQECSRVSYTRKDTGTEHTEWVERDIWKPLPAPWFDWDSPGFLEARVPVPPGQDTEANRATDREANRATDRGGNAGGNE